MGRIFLATLFGRLTDCQRADAALVARSNMCSVLKATPTLELTDPKQLDWLAQMVTDELGGEQGTQRRESDA